MKMSFLGEPNKWGYGLRSLVWDDGVLSGDPAAVAAVLYFSQQLSDIGAVMGMVPYTDRDPADLKDPSVVYSIATKYVFLRVLEFTSDGPALDLPKKAIA